MVGHTKHLTHPDQSFSSAVHRSILSKFAAQYETNVHEVKEKRT